MQVFRLVTVDDKGTETIVDYSERGDAMDAWRKLARHVGRSLGSAVLWDARSDAPWVRLAEAWESGKRPD